MTLMIAERPLAADDWQKNFSTVTATVLETSKLPDPDVSEYEDCLVGHKVKINRQHRGDPVAKKCVVFFWGFKRRHLREASAFKVDQNLYLKLIPFELAPENIQQVRQVYQFEDILEYDWYYCVEFKMAAKNG